MAIFVFSQNVKLESLKKYSDLGEKDNMIVTTQYLFENERKFLNIVFQHCRFYTFADFLSDHEMANIDQEAYESTHIAYEKYLSNIKKKKNELVVKKVLELNSSKKCYIFSNDLGIELKVWLKKGFQYCKCEYYYQETFNLKTKAKNWLKQIPGIKTLKRVVFPQKGMHIPEEVLVAQYKGRKYVFLGKMNRIGYRLNMDFLPSEEECKKINCGQYEAKDTCTYITTWHEHSKCDVPDKDIYEVRWCQDGYLPPNYTHKDYYFKPKNVKYYCWDILGTKLFKNQGLPYEIIPFRKKIYIPEPIFPQKVKNILIVASGSGDWTALKNRSDDDIMVDAFVQMAKKFPDIHFTYRCHPTWVHPQNVGVNAINRVQEYFEWINLPNLTLSGNIPPMKTQNGFKYSFNRSSLEADLKGADFVIGEHSISMIDAAFDRIPFFSVNITNRRNFFIGLNNLGFPSCSSIQEIEQMIKTIGTTNFKEQFLKAIDNYNKMTDMEH